MISNVDPADLFPELSSIEGTYEEAKAHALAVDALLGYRILEAESLVQGAPWTGLDPAILQTPYTEIRYCLAQLNLHAGNRGIELGSGYSRMAHVLERHHPGVRYLGIESVSARANEAIRVIRARGLSHSEVLHLNLFQLPELPSAQVYFLYDLSSKVEDTDQILEMLRFRASQAAIQVVGRGRATRTRIERAHPWLSEVIPPRHFGNFSIYRSAEAGETQFKSPSF